MSDWTYVNGTIRVTVPFYTVKKDRVKEYIEWAINQVKKRGCDITGSEGPAEYFVNIPAHPTMYSSESTDSWDNAYIQIIGSLRDRMQDQTRNEVNAFLKRLNYYMIVEGIDITVSGSGEPEEIIEHAYSFLYDYSDDEHYDEYEKYRDKLFRIQLANRHKFYDSLMTFKAAADIAELISNASPNTIEGFLCNFGLNRIIDWTFTDNICDWYKEHKVSVPDQDDKQYDKWFRKKKYPPKHEDQKLVDELHDKAYGKDSYDYDEVEKVKNKRLYRIVEVAIRDKDVMKKVNMWG